MKLLESLIKTALLSVVLIGAYIFGLDDSNDEGCDGTEVNGLPGCDPTQRRC